MLYALLYVLSQHFNPVKSVQSYVISGQWGTGLCGYKRARSRDNWPSFPAKNGSQGELYRLVSTRGVIGEFCWPYFTVRPAKFEKSFFSSRPINLTNLIFSACTCSTDRG